MLKFERYELAYKLLVGYMYILLFGSWGMKLIGIPPTMGLPILGLLDIFPLGIWILSNPKFRIQTNSFFIDTLNFWFIWFIILLLLLSSGFRHEGSLLPSLVHWGALIRYIPLAYIVLSLNKHIDINCRLIQHIKIITITLLAIAYACLLLGDNATIFLPLLPQGATGGREIVHGNYSGVFANTIDLAFILVLLYVICIYKKEVQQKKVWWITLLFFIPVFKTGSAIAAAVFCFIAFIRLTQGLKLVRYSALICFGIILGIIAYTYWDLIRLVIENIQLSRLGMLTLTLPDFLSEMSVDTWLGVGNDGHVVLDKVNGYKEHVFMLEHASSGDISAFGDVYWVALLVFHGIIGLGLIVFLYFQLYRDTVNKQYTDNNYDYNLIIKWFFFTIVIFAFLNQVIVVKTFALIFWLFLSITYTKVIPREDIANK